METKFAAGSKRSGHRYVKTASGTRLEIWKNNKVSHKINFNTRAQALAFIRTAKRMKF